jgi:hypothetical protein
MNRSLLFMVLFLLGGMLQAQEKFSEFKVGVIGPSGAKSGFFGGVNLGRSVDQNIGVSASIDLYRSSYTKETKVATEKDAQGNVIETIQTELEQSTTMIPLFFNIYYQGVMPAGFNLRAGGGLGYELLWSSFTNYETDKDDTQFFSGFGWHLDAGITYPLSQKSDIFGEVLYHGGAPSRDETENDEGLPVRSEIKMDGLGFRVGIRLYGLGI